VANDPKRTLHEEVAEALIGNVDPNHLDAFQFAGPILAVFDLIRSLFSVDQVDTCLKLMFLHELTRAGGRRTLEQLRAVAGFLEPGRVESIVQSLYRGGWLELRASDHSYAASMTGLHLLSVLRAADLGNVSPKNAISRSAQVAQFGAELDGASGALAYLLDNLYLLVETEVDAAKTVLRGGRPYRLIAWSRAQHTRQLETIRGVLDSLEEKLEQASRELTRVTRLHAMLQEMIHMHGSINARLREWNLEQLHTTEAGYSINQLVEGVLGADDEALMACLGEGFVQGPHLTPSLSTEEVQVRFHAARRRLTPELQDWSYEPPEPVESEEWSPAVFDPAALLRAHLTQVLGAATDERPVLELEAWLPEVEEALDGPFGFIAWQLAVLGRLEKDGPLFLLDDGRNAEVLAPQDDVPRSQLEELLTDMVHAGALRELDAGHFTRLRVTLSTGERDE